MKIAGSLARYILPDTTESIFWRGYKYYRDGKVSIREETDKKLSGFVHGSDVYNVEFRQGPKLLRVIALVNILGLIIIIANILLP